MDALMGEFMGTIDWFTGHLSPGTIRIILKIFGALVLLLAFEYIAYAFGSAQVGWARILFAAVLGTVLLVGAAAANSVYILPELDSALVLLATIAIPVLALVIIITPLNCLLRKSKYFCMLSSFSLGILASFLFFSAANAVLGSVRAGGEKSNTIRERRLMTDEFLEKKSASNLSHP
jgi:hypothetical protein